MTLKEVLIIHVKRTIGVRGIVGIEELMIGRIEILLQFERKCPIQTALSCWSWYFIFKLNCQDLCRTNV